MAPAISATRAWNIAFRTAHIGVTGVLLGGHVFQIPAVRLLPFLYFSILTGAALGIIDIFPDWHGLFEIRSLAIAAKLLMMGSIPWLWSYRVAILVGVLVIASASSHMPRRLRHFSILGIPPPGGRPGTLLSDSHKAST